MSDGLTGNDEKKTHIGFQIPADLWVRFRRVANARMLNATALMRTLMLREVETFEREQADRGQGGAR